jgi:hypothetical protein
LSINESNTGKVIHLDCYVIASPICANLISIGAMITIAVGSTPGAIIITIVVGITPDIMIAIRDTITLGDTGHIDKMF